MTFFLGALLKWPRFPLGIIKEVSLEMVPPADVGDYVLVHVGVAISKVNEEEAKKVFGYLKEAGELDELYDMNA